MSRADLIEGFLGNHGWGRARRGALAADASFRHYERLSLDGKTAVLMDAPPPEEDVRAFVKIARHLCANGFSAPQVLAADEDAGLLLLEDLGDDTYTRLLEAGEDERRLYELAVDVLVELHRHAAPSGLLPYGNGRLLDEAFLAPQWVFDDIPLPEPVRREYGEAWLEVFPLVHATGKTLVLRDYHVDNLIGLPDRDGVRAAFDIAFTVLAAQRHAKVIGIFNRLDRRDGKPGYLVHLPRVWRLLEAALEQPQLARLRVWFDEHMPAEVRK